jgi:hypothetical protein
MKKRILAIIFSTFLFSASTFAGAVTHSVEASKHSGLAMSEGLASTAMVASAVVAIPVVVVAGISMVAASVVVEAADSLGESVNNSHRRHHARHTYHQRLVITEKTITADPAPRQVMNPINN